MSNGKRKVDPLAPTRPLQPVRDPNRHRCREDITVEVHTGKVERLLICECGQRVLLWRGTIEGFHAVPPLVKP